jgi:putative membrane protein
MSAVHDPGTVKPPHAARLALERTRLAYERTLLAWVRTAIALISFGFTAYKFFQFLHESGQAPPPHRLFGSREFALVMIGIGLVALLLATLEHRGNMRRLRAVHKTAGASLAGWFAGVVAILGILGFLAVVFRQ